MANPSLLQGGAEMQSTAHLVCSLLIHVHATGDVVGAATVRDNIHAPTECASCTGLM